jgi:hypothetical protein
MKYKTKEEKNLDVVFKLLNMIHHKHISHKIDMDIIKAKFFVDLESVE